MTQGQLRKPRSNETARQPFASVTGPNATWCADFKGHFATGDGKRCYPLTVIDAHSRFLIRCEGVLDPDGREVMRIFDSAFQEFGLPAAIRSDNGGSTCKARHRLRLPRPSPCRPLAPLADHDRSTYGRALRQRCDESRELRPSLRERPRDATCPAWLACGERRRSDPDFHAWVGGAARFCSLGFEGARWAREHQGRMRKTTRRFFARPFSVSFVSMGTLLPSPALSRRSFTTPRPTSHASTDAARRALRSSL